VTLLGSRGWRPNDDAVAWFGGEVWPAVLRALPGARLHVFGIDEPRAAPRHEAAAAVRWHGPPADSAAAFAAGSVHVVPLRIGSGVRMKVLEAWARGVPVVSTPEGAAGLGAADGAELLLARDGPSFAAAFRRLREEPGLAATLVRGGRDALRGRHDPADVARRLLAVYDQVLASWPARP
jgi:glycosyltransferase involved in cell wall biosynthesis